MTQQRKQKLMVLSLAIRELYIFFTDNRSNTHIFAT
jgi:hypothetical protein